MEFFRLFNVFQSSIIYVQASRMIAYELYSPKFFFQQSVSEQLTEYIWHPWKNYLCLAKVQMEDNIRNLFTKFQTSKALIKISVQTLVEFIYFKNQMDKDSNPIDLNKLKLLIHTGVEAIPVDNENQDAVIMIGDTGVGKSTIMSFLCGSKLVVKYDGLKPTLDNLGQTKIKIGHQKYSETSIPTKVVIDKMAFYDCPGFKDNKGQEYEISNSFFVQRLLDLYKNVKLVLVVDQSHISEARADKLPKLIRNLHKAFKTFEDIKEGVLLVINRAGRENTVEDYQKQIQKMIMLKNQNGYLFLEEQRKFINFLVQSNRILLFKQAQKDQKNQEFQASKNERSILQTIKECKFVKSKHIQNILSQSAKLSIRDFIDEITIRSNYKIDIICAYLVETYSQRVHELGRNVNEILLVKEQIIKLGEEIKSSKKQDVIKILQREMPADKLQDFEEDFSSVMFFKGIYDKTSTYFSNLVNKIYSELSHLLTKLDKRITSIQRQQQEEATRQKEVQQQKVKEQKRQQEKQVAMEHCSKMDELKEVAKNLVSTKRNLIEEIKSAMKCLASVEEELKVVKKDTVNLKKLSKEIDTEFERIEVTYFTKKTAKS